MESERDRQKMANIKTGTGTDGRTERYMETNLQTERERERERERGANDIILRSLNPFPKDKS